MSDPYVIWHQCEVGFMKPLKINPNTLDNLCSLLLVLLFYMGLFYVLDVFHINVQVFHEGEYVYSVFSVGYDLTNFLLLLIRMQQHLQQPILQEINHGKH